ncbi:6919_t:CDS:1, partial [Scutellospora calospora]
IWRKIERLIIVELCIKIDDRWDIDISEQNLKEVFLEQDVAEILSRRKLHIR